MQSIISPVLSTCLYFVVFGAAIGGRISEIEGVSYGLFIVPGLIMLTLLTQSVMNGATLSQLREHQDLIDIVARAVPDERLNLDMLKDINLYTRQGAVVPLINPAPVKDLAPVTGSPARLKRTDEEQPGFEMPAFAFFTNTDGTQTKGLYFAMARAGHEEHEIHEQYEEDQRAKARGTDDVAGDDVAVSAEKTPVPTH